MWTSVHQRKKIIQKPRHGPMMPKAPTHQRHSRHTKASSSTWRASPAPRQDWSKLYSSTWLGSISWVHLSSAADHVASSFAFVKLTRRNAAIYHHHPSRVVQRLSHWAVGILLGDAFPGFYQSKAQLCRGCSWKSRWKENGWMCWLKLSHQYSFKQ